MIGPFTLHPKVTRPVNPWVFYLLPGLSAQGRAMVHFAIDRMKQPVEADRRGPGRHPRARRRSPRERCSTPRTTRCSRRSPRRWSRRRRRRAGTSSTARSYVPGAVDALRLASTLATYDSETIFFLGAELRPPDPAPGGGALQLAPDGLHAGRDGRPGGARHTARLRGALLPVVPVAARRPLAGGGEGLQRADQGPRAAPAAPGHPARHPGGGEGLRGGRQARRPRALAGQAGRRSSTSSTSGTRGSRRC